MAPGDAAPGTGDKAATGVVAVVFFISGMPALVYQLIWQRSLFTMYGINVEAVTIVVAGFLLGLGFGSLLGGRIPGLSRLNLLVAFGAIEVTVDAIGILLLRVIDIVGRHTLLLPIEALTIRRRLPASRARIN